MISLPERIFELAALGFIFLVTLIAPIVIIWWCFYQPENGD